MIGTIEDFKRKADMYKKRWLREKRKNKKKIVTKAEAKKAVRKFLPDKAARFFEEQIDVAGKKTSARWSNYMKTVALQLRSAGPKAYQILRKILNLPSPRTLSTILQKVNITPGWHKAVLMALQHIAKDLNPLDRLVVLSFDEITLKANVTYNKSSDQVEGLDKDGNIANHAGVFMLRSLTGKWKQPFGYFLTRGTMPSTVLKDEIMMAIEKVKSTGFIPICFVMDQGTNNMSAVRQLGVSQDKPYFTVKDTRIYMIFDPPHLMKSVRNNLKNHGFLVNKQLASWTDLVELFQQDGRRKIRMVPRLTQKHIALPAFSSMNVSLATQVNIL